MADEREVDICVIGAGAAGLSVAAGTAQMGAPTVLVERGEMGGECLNSGCVPSKALLASARAAALVARAPALGVRLNGAGVEFADVSKHVHATIAAIAPNDSVERFKGLGATVIKGSARFVSPRTIEVDGMRIGARRFVIATGSRPLVPPIPGLAEAGYLTNETVFDLAQLPEHLIIVGGGPIGVELAQAFRQLGARVSVVEQFSILARDDPELAGVVRDRLVDDGVAIREGATVTHVQRTDKRVVVTVRDSNGAEDTVEGSHVLVAAGRRASVDDLGLETAGIAFDAAGVKVNARLRTDNRRVFAIGDVVRGGHRFTHMCTYHAAIVIRNALFRIPARVRLDAFPWVTFTAPELAQVGLTEQQAVAKGGGIRILRWPFADIDRARAEAEIDGLVKVVATPRGRILGAGIVGPHAGELIQTWVLAIQERLGLGAIAKMVSPYPTFGEVSKRAAGSFFAPTLFGPQTRRLVRWLRHLG
ncbi:MAG: FAD-dependent oxidoreductase [Rhodospirillales bacterium]|jgi:pyruvate/2-oxoglutarate dehydrogenase complex dihydrolipoamide dehydrogenase (E3) component|nr:FAD-dependent oxidoreductase [Rhodospirillales bacterium]